MTLGQVRKDKKIKKLWSMLITVSGFLFFAVNLAMAQTADDQTGSFFAEQIGLASGDPKLIIANVVRIALGFAGLIFVILIIYGGWMYMTSEGVAEKVTKAREIIKNSVIGILIIMSAFVIVSFIISSLQDGTAGGNLDGGGSISFRSGLGALGACSVESIYPDDLAKDVARNSSIIITFKEAINPATICQLNTGETKCNGGGATQVNKETTVRVYRQSQKEACTAGETGCELVKLKIYSNDNQTFVLVPESYLGSASENTWYEAYFSNSIKKSNGDAVFKNCRTDYLNWQFEVSNKLDLVPPQVKSIFPPFDNEADLVASSASAIPASGSILVKAIPQASAEAKTSNLKITAVNSPAVKINGTYNCSGEETITVSVTADGKVKSGGVDGLVNGDEVSDKNLSIGCGLSLVPVDVQNEFSAGNAWSFKASPVKQADTLTVGSEVLVFGSDITVGTNLNSASANIAIALANNALVNAEISNDNSNKITISAKVAGVNGNTIALSASNSDSLAITALSGGQDKVETSSIKGKPDQPRNAILQINFNEPVLPMGITGTSEEVKNYIKVMNGDTLVGGKFVLSNQYKTLEFIPDNECGVNSCGEKIYCLPGNANLTLKLNSASLLPCAGVADCATRAPYTTCTNGVCRDTTGTNYPTANQPINGAVDTAFNSLDGNGNGKAEGQISFYNLNNPTAGTGDNYQWSFFTSNLLDNSAPRITASTPEVNGSGADLNQPVTLTFNKLMMSSYLRTGATTFSVTGSDGKTTETTAQFLNLWSYADAPLGYWITKNDLESGTPDGAPDYSQVLINHSMLADTAKYRAQAGSGIKDIYQNCFLPCSGISCNGNPSCCNGSSINDSKCAD